MEKQDRIINILIILIVILLIIFGLKIFGVIKSNTKTEEKKQIEKVEETENEISTLDLPKEENMKVTSALKLLKYEKMIASTIFEIIIAILIVAVVLAIGRYMLYQKIGVNPKLNLMNAIISSGIGFGIISSIIGFIFRGSMLISLIYPILIVVILVSTKINYYIVTKSIKGINIIVWVLAILLNILIPKLGKEIGLVTFINTWIVEATAAFHLIDFYNKASGYKVLAILAPEILVAIFGFQKNKVRTKHKLDLDLDLEN